MCPGCPAHLKNVQLRCKCSIRLSGAESTKQAIKEGLYSAKGTPPSKAPFKLQRLRKLALPCLKGAVQLPKGLFFFCFKYQNYKNQFINCFSKTTTKTKQSPESKQNKILSKVLITLLLKLKPSTHTAMWLGRERGPALLGDHMARRFPRVAMVYYLRTMEWVTAVHPFSPSFQTKRKHFRLSWKSSLSFKIYL